MNDIIIIGAGIIGCSIARELSKYKLDVVLLEKAHDVSNGATKANSGIVHGAYAAENGTLKAKFNYIGNRMYDKLNKNLNFGYRKTGGLVLAFDNEEVKIIENLYNNSLKNGEKDVRIINKNEILKIQPNINFNVKKALLANDVGIVSPYEMAIALAENSVNNNVKLFLNSEVESIKKISDYFEVNTKNHKIFQSRYIINCAGVESSNIASLLEMDNFKIIPKKGQYILFHKDTGKTTNKVVFQTPTKKGKGILVTSTYHGNLVIGPNSEVVDSIDNLKTDIETVDYIIKNAKKSIPDFDFKKVLRSYSGIRATSDKGDFIIEESQISGFINAAGIDSPGLTSAPAIAIEVINILNNIGLRFEEKKYFCNYRKPIIIKKNLSANDIKDKLSIEGEEKLICRCEQVYQKEIVDALSRDIDISTIDAVKRRTRAGMGFCQGKFCKPRVKEIIKIVKNIEAKIYEEDDTVVKYIKKNYK